MLTFADKAKYSDKRTPAIKQAAVSETKNKSWLKGIGFG
jgi:hypothetical protein